MNISDLITFFDYRPIMDENPQFLMDTIKDQASDYLTLEQLDLLQETYEYAHKAHHGQMRQSWEPYISHILQATHFLMMIHPDCETIQWCLLHDVIEDCDITSEEIEKRFGKTVRTLCDGVTKVSKLKYRGEERQIETMKKTFFAMSQDLRVIFIKLADRIHNIQTLHFHTKPEKQKRIIDETLEIYVPITERLGLHQFQYLLENWCFRILHPQDAHQIISYLDRPIFVSSAERGCKILTKLLHSEWLKHFTIKGRLKSPYSIYKKLTQKIGSNDIKKINDILAFRIITDTIPSCYLIMGIVHNTYIPLVHKIKDFIVVPKPNGYRSIHSIILGMFDFPVEIQIRTDEMNRYAEYGVAAHFAYKELGYTPPKACQVKVDPRQSERVKKLQEIVNSYQHDNEWFQQEMKIELLEKSIFLYTPKGTIIELKEWATVLDFAFRVHSEVGLRFKHALVNGSIVPIDYQPKTGDIVSIQTWRQKYSVNQGWLLIAKTNWARSQINKFLKVHHKQEYTQKALALLKERLIESNLPAFQSTECLIWWYYHNKPDQRTSMLLELYEKWGYMSFIHSYYPIVKKNTSEYNNTIKNQWLSKDWKHILIDGNNRFEYIYCPECISSDLPLIAKSTSKGIKIHHIGCKALSTISYEKLLSAHYEHEEPVLYNCSIKLAITNKAGNLNKILQLLYDFHLNIKHISFLDTNDDVSIGELVVEVANPSKISFLIKEIEKYDNVAKILSKKLIV